MPWRGDRVRHKRTGSQGSRLFFEDQPHRAHEVTTLVRATILSTVFSPACRQQRALAYLRMPTALHAQNRSHGEMHWHMDTPLLADRPRHFRGPGGHQSVSHGRGRGTCTAGRRSRAL